MVTFNLEQIRQAAERVAASHRLEIVEIEYLGGSKHRVLRIFIEKNREERMRRAAEAEALRDSEVEGEHGMPAHALAGNAALDRLAWVTHEDCEQFSRDLGTLLDVEDLVPGASYTLEVSSPGLDRRLRGAADFNRFRGSVIKVRTFAPIAGNRHWQGRLIDTGAASAVLRLGEAGEKNKRRKGAATAETVEIEFSNIEKANLVPEF